MDIVEKKLFDSNNKNIISLVKEKPEHAVMLNEISKNLPEINRGTSLFGKSQSQFMDNHLTVSHFTPLRNLRQILAEVNKTKTAYIEADIKGRKKEVEIEVIKRKAEKEEDDLNRELLYLEVEKLASELYSTRNYISGAIRKITNYMAQYNSIKEANNIGEFTEEDVEKEEEAYHISKAFEQGLDAARGNNGMIDHGNQIYFSQIGINGTVAQRCVSGYFANESAILERGEEPSREMQNDFIWAMIKKFKGCSQSVSRHKGMTGKPTDIALVKG